MAYSLKRYLIYFIVTSVFLTLFGSCSPLLKLNGYTDINVLFTIGRAIIHGKRLYTDIFDHKGPILYFIYALCSFISEKSYFGIFLIEILCISIFLYYCEKITESLFNKKYTFFHSFCCLILIVSNAFNGGGGTVEEFFLPIFQITNFICLKKITNKEAFTYKECIIIGIFACLSFLSKFTLAGYYLGLALCLVIYQYKINKNKVISCILFTLSSFLVTFVITCLYFILNNNFNDFIDTYFLFNLFNYQGLSRSFIVKLLTQFNQYIFYFKKNILFTLLSFSGLIYAIIHYKKSYITLFILSTFLIWNLFTFFNCSMRVSYYVLPIAIYMVFSGELINKIKFDKLIYSLIIFYYVLTSSNHVSQNTPEEDYVQYEFAKIIGDSSFTIYREFDCGFFFATQQTPSCKYFTQVNGNIEDYESNTLNCIKDNQIEYLIYGDPELQLKDYSLIKSRGVFYLYKLNH